MAGWKRILAAGLVIICLGLPVVAAQAGEIEVVLPGGSMALYPLDEYFLDLDLEGLKLTGEAAEKLAAYVRIHGIAGTIRGVEPSGIVRFSGLSEGTYLLVQQEAAEGYRPVRPFLVRLDGCGKITATPKTGKIPGEENPGTGDGFCGFAVVVLAVSLLGLGCWVFQKRRT